MRVGAIVKPVTNMTTASMGSDVTTKNSETPRARATMPIANRFHSGETQCRAPYARPEMSEPIAKTARIRPDADLDPCSSANAMVETSVAPKMNPIATNTTARTTIPGDRIADRCLTPGTDGITGARCGAATGTRRRPRRPRPRGR